MKLFIVDKETKEKVTDEELLMKLACVDHACRFETVGVQDDGTPVVFNKCGNFGYLDPERYSAYLDLDLINVD